MYRWKRHLGEAGKDNNLDILVHSPGGSLNECYRIARLLARYTDNWEALVPKYAQSGATLICLGSSKIVLSEGAQLSPLDPQVISKRRGKFFVGERQSPLEAFRAVRELRNYAMGTMQVAMGHLYEVQRVAPQPALDTATKLAAELAQPILEKIEPYDLGAFALDSAVAKGYCSRLCTPAPAHKAVQAKADHGALVERYPAHEFVIDLDEATALGLNAEQPPEALDVLFERLRPFLSVPVEDRIEELFYVGLVPAGGPTPDDQEGEP